MLPWDPMEGRRYTNPGGIRLGTSEVTRLGMKEKEMDQIAEWFKELLLNGQQHLEATSPFKTFDVSKPCQEYLNTGNILHFFYEHAPELLEKLG